MLNERLLTVDDVAKMLGVHRNSVERWIRSGKLKAKKIGRKYFTTTEALEKMGEPNKGGEEINLFCKDVELRSESREVGRRKKIEDGDDDVVIADVLKWGMIAVGFIVAAGWFVNSGVFNKILSNSGELKNG